MTKCSLPKGIHDRAGSEYEREFSLLTKAKLRSEKFGCSPIVTAPVGFQETFLNGREDFRDRAYNLVDKRGRDLMLTPDSSPLVIRWIATQDCSSTPRRLFFTSPVFRYRNQKYRYFRHIGFAFGNTAENIQEEDLTLTTAFKLMTQFLRDDCDHPISITLGDAGIWHSLLREEIPSAQDRRRLLHRLRFRRGRGADSLLAEQLNNGKLVDAMLGLLEAGELSTAYSSQVSARHERLENLRDTVSFRTGVNVNIDLRDLRGTETQNNITAQFKNERGELCGDGGCYSDYARRISPSMKSFISVATGLEYLVENQRPNPIPPKVCIISFHDVLAQAQDIESSLQSNGIGVIIQPVIRSLVVTERLLSADVKWVIALGRKELVCGQIDVRNIKTGVKKLVKLTELVALTFPSLMELV